MNYKEFVKKRNAFLLLISLFVYAFSLIFVFHDEPVNVEYSDTSYQTNFVDFAERLEYRESIELEQVEKIVVEDESGSEEEVKGWKSFFPARCEASTKINAPQLFCGESGTLIDADIKIAEITAPDIMFVGAAAPFDNLVQVNNPAGRVAFRNASEIIHPEFDYLIKMPPLPDDHESNPRKHLLPEGTKKDPYDMHYETLGQIDEVAFDVHPEEQSLCPETVNDGRFNVTASNSLQNDLTKNFSPPGLMELGNRDVSARLCRDDVRTIHMDEDQVFTLCAENILQKFWCGIVDTFSANDDACDQVHGIVIDAPLGSGEICNEEDCSVRYSEAGRLISSPPIWTDDLYPQALTSDERKNDYIVDDPVVIRTPCKVRVDCTICLTDCIWDVSMWQHYFDMEQMFTYPGFKNAMEEEEYWEGVEHELKVRGRLGIGNFY